MAFDPKKIKDKHDLFRYMTEDYHDEDYRQTVMLLMFVPDVGDKDIYDILHYVVHNDKKLFVMYGGNEPPDGAVYVGGVPDGALYYI